MKKIQVTVPIICRSCGKQSLVSRAAAFFWDDNSDIDYACSQCINSRIHHALIASDAAKLDAVTNAYLTLARNNQPLPS